jgi:hypothetical protein
MPNLFPCPNTQCAYQFDADILPAAAMVTCPLCRTKFPYRASRPLPGATSAAGEGAPQNDAIPSGPRMVTLRQGPNPGSVWITVGWVAGFTAVLLGLLTAAYVWNNKKPLGSGGGSDPYKTEQLNFVLDPFGPEWKEDPDVRKGLDVSVYARKKVNADAWAALYAKDYGNTNPRRGELRDRLIGSLKGFFTNVNTVELEGAKWAGQSAMAYQFDGDMNDVHVVGECHAIGYKGIAYAMYIFAPAKDWEAMKPELYEIRNKFKLANYREKWTEEVSNVKTYVATLPQGGKYEVSDIDGKWKAAKQLKDGEKAQRDDYLADPKELDPKATMAFLISYVPRSAKDRRVQEINVFALVVELDGGGDPLETARKYAVDYIKRKPATGGGDVQLKPYAKSPSGIDIPQGDPATARFEYQDPDSPTSKELWILSAINVGNKTVAVMINTPMLTASYVEEWMIHFARSLKKSE